MQWRSETLMWVGLGAVAALAMFWRGAEPPPERQNQYQSRADCERDYDAGQCTTRAGGGAGFFGPRYVSDTATSTDPGPGRTATDGRSHAASHTSTFARGGFGATGRSHGGGYG